MTCNTLDALPQVVFETAAEHLTSRVPIAAPADRVVDIRRALEGQRFDTVAEIAICEEGKLIGLLNIEDVLAAPEETLAHQIMDPDPPVVAPGLDQEVAAWKAVQHGESSLAVVDAAGRFVGMIPPIRLLTVLLWEHDEDMARLGGFLRDTASARTAGQEAVRRRVLAPVAVALSRARRRVRRRGHRGHVRTPASGPGDPRLLPARRGVPGRRGRHPDRGAGDTRAVGGRANRQRDLSGAAHRACSWASPWR